MKLRIKGNSLRLRLTQVEVKRFEEKGMVEEVIKFGNSAAARMYYTLQKSSGKEIDAFYYQNRMMVNIPESIAETWTTTNQVSIFFSMKINEDEDLLILVEKDFQCLKPREGEDESELFPNPEEGRVEC